MIYRWKITTDANTLATSKKETILEVTRGKVYKVEFKFPPGPMGYLHVQVFRALHQVWPYNTGEDFSTDGETISFNDTHWILEPPYQFEAFTWNLDDTYNHDLFIRIGIEPIVYETIVIPERGGFL